MSEDTTETKTEIDDVGSVTTELYEGQVAYVILVDPEPSPEAGKLIAQCANDFQLAGETRADVEALVAHLSHAFPDRAFKLEWFGDETPT